MEQKPLKLPFMHRRRDAGEWAYDHRVGMCVTIIVYLLAGIAMVSAKIVVNSTPPPVQGMLIEFPPDQAKPDQRLIELHDQYDDLSDVRNLASNENAPGSAAPVSGSLNDRLRDAKGTDAGEIYSEADAVQNRLREGRAAYEKGLRDNEALANGRTTSGDNTRSQDVKIKGRVTVSFSFSDPVRNSVRLTVPAYQCEGGGEVIISVILNRKGEVSSASVAGASSSADNCMKDCALSAARTSRFNIDTSAPERHQGTISYIFIPQ